MIFEHFEQWPVEMRIETIFSGIRHLNNIIKIITGFSEAMTKCSSLHKILQCCNDQTWSSLNNHPIEQQYTWLMHQSFLTMAPHSRGRAGDSR